MRNSIGEDGSLTNSNHRHSQVTIGYDLAWGKYNKEQNDLRIRNHMVSFTSGYSF